MFKMTCPYLSLSDQHHIGVTERLRFGEEGPNVQNNVSMSELPF